ncbi:unnamed protein product, partial [marine sediment metagenome]
MRVLSFTTDGTVAAGTGAELNSGALSVSLPFGIRILAIKQAAGAVLVNDADWTLWVDYKSTGMTFVAEALDPVNDGGVKLGPTGITVRPSAVIQMFWAAQAAAQ